MKRTKKNDLKIVLFLFTTNIPYDIISLVENEVKKLNQILYIESKKNQKADIRTIIKFFAIAVIVFGVVFVGSAAFNLLKKQNAGTNIPPETIPTIKIESDGEKVYISVEHDKELTAVFFRWNDEEEKEINTYGQNVTGRQEDLLQGTNTLFVRAVDILGKETTAHKDFVVEATKPVIEVSDLRNGDSIRIRVRDSKELQYITYRWDDRR